MVRLARSHAVRNVAAVVVVAALVGLGFGWGILSAGTRNAPAVDPAAVQTATQLSRAFKAAAMRVRPAVVSIQTTREVRAAFGRRRSAPRRVPDDLRRFFGDDFFDRFFPDEGFPIPPQAFRAEGHGSGVIVSADGLILTNNHVVARADKVIVHLADGREFDAKVVGTDPKTDVAVLRIPASGLVPARLGDSDRVEVGDWVLAVGSPFQLDQTVTAGIISAKGRADVGLAVYEDYLQTDAAVNPGNSGGPLVNLQGEVIGINTAIASRNGGNMGIGFAIPINMARQVMDQLVTKGHVDRGFLGVQLQPMTRALARSFGLDRPEGALVADVSPGTGAAKAGIKPGDIIIRFNGEKVDSGAELRRLVAEIQPGRRVPVEVLRNGKRLTFQVEIGQLPEEEVADAEPAGPPGADRQQSSRVGLTVQTLTPAGARELGQPEDLKGVVVVDVRPGSLAAQAGLRPGDVILSVGDVTVTDAASYRSAMRKADLKSGIRLHILRGRIKLFVFLRAA